MKDMTTFQPKAKVIGLCDRCHEGISVGGTDFLVQDECIEIDRQADVREIGIGHVDVVAGISKVALALERRRSGRAVTITSTVSRTPEELHRRPALVMPLLKSLYPSIMHGVLDNARVARASALARIVASEWRPGAGSPDALWNQGALQGIWEICSISVYYVLHWPGAPAV